MKLAIITARPPSKVALSEYGNHLVEHFSLQEDITEIILITNANIGDNQSSFTTTGCKITMKEGWHFNGYTTLIKLNKVLNSTKPDAVFINLQYSMFGNKKIAAALGLLLPVVCKLRRIPTITLVHHILEKVDFEKVGVTNNGILKKIYSKIGGLLTKAILVSDVLAVTTVKNKTILENTYQCRNVAVVPFGTYNTNIKPDYSLPAGSKRILAYGEFGTYKKVEVLIDGVELIRKNSETNIEIVIAGTDSPNALGYLDAMKEKYAHVKQLSFIDHVNEEDVPVIFGNTVLIVHPYTSIKFSAGILNLAGSYGKAVVAPNLGDFKTLVKEEKFKVEFYEAGNAVSLAEAIEGILLHDSYRKYLAIANYMAASAKPMKESIKMYIEYFKVIRLANAKGFSINVPLIEKELLL